MPYNVALVDLDEGFRMMSTVHALAADEVPIGVRVMANLVQHDDDGPLLVFVPVEG